MDLSQIRGFQRSKLNAATTIITTRNGDKFEEVNGEVKGPVEGDNSVLVHIELFSTADPLPLKVQELTFTIDRNECLVDIQQRIANELAINDSSIEKVLFGK